MAAHLRIIELDGTGWKSKGDFYDAILAALKAPEWHGRNLDALWDSISGDDINDVRTPYRLKIQGGEIWDNELASFMIHVVRLIKDARAEGIDVDIDLC